MFSLKDKTALVTGSTFGIGLGIIRVLARAGANVVMNGRKPPDDLEELLGELSSHGNRAIFIPADVTQGKDRERLFRESLKAFGRFDILVNNAGSLYDRGWERLNEDIFDRTIDLNVKAAFFMSKQAIDHFRKLKQRGSIVLVASTNSFAAERGSPCYDTSKGALLMMTRTLAVQTFDDSINVNALCPGLITTPLIRRLSGDEGTFQMIGCGVPKGRFGTIEECGYAVLYMVSDEAQYMTGQHITLDGGILAIQHTQVSNLGDKAPEKF